MERGENNMKRTEIVARTEELAAPIIDENDFELVDVEYVKEGANWYLRVYATKKAALPLTTASSSAGRLRKSWMRKTS